MNDIDRRVAEILGWWTNSNGDWYHPVASVPTRKAKDGPPPFSTCQTLIGEMLAWFRGRNLNIQLLFTVHGAKVDVLDWAYDLQVSRDGDSINLALCKAIIAINTTPADAGEVGE